MNVQIRNAPDPQATEALKIRAARKADVADIHRLILCLAEEEGYQADEIEVDANLLNTALFAPDPKALAVVATIDEDVVAVAVCYWTFSTLLGRAGLHLDDLYVLPAHRGSQIGTRMMIHLAELARASGARRLEWWVLSSNPSAMRFYAGLGAKPVPDVSVCRLSGAALAQLSNSSPMIEEEPA